MRLLVNSCSSVWRCFSAFGAFFSPAVSRSVWALSSLCLLSIIILIMYTPTVAEYRLSLRNCCEWLADLIGRCWT